MFIDYIVFVATPLAPQGATDTEKQIDLDRNLAFAKQTCRAIALAGAATFGPHLYYTHFLSDALPSERELGIKLGLMHMRRSDEILLRLPPWRGVLSTGMNKERMAAHSAGLPVTLITTDDEFSAYLERIHSILTPF